jgi:hypothetical protein
MQEKYKNASASPTEKFAYRYKNKTYFWQP